MTTTRTKRNELKRQRLEENRARLQEEYVYWYKRGIRSSLIIKWLAYRYMIAEFTVRDRLGSQRELQESIKEPMLDEIFSTELL